MRKHLLKLFLFTAVAVFLLTAAAAWVVLTPIALKGEQVDFTIVPGSSMRVAARELAAAGVELEPWALILLGKLMRVDTSIKAGSYEIVAGITPLELLKKLTRGDVTQAELAFIEGWTFRQMRERLDAHPDLRHDTTGPTGSGDHAPDRCAGRGCRGPFLSRHLSSLPSAAAMSTCWPAPTAMQQHLAREWQARAVGCRIEEPYQALIMASIVEKETGRAEDRRWLPGCSSIACARECCCRPIRR
jgi:UPF0755 protein